VNCHRGGRRTSRTDGESQCLSPPFVYCLLYNYL